MPFDWSSMDSRLLDPGQVVALIADPSRTGVTQTVDVLGGFRGPMACILWHERERSPSTHPLTALRLVEQDEPNR